MGKIVQGTLLSVVLVIFISGAVAVYTVFFSSADSVTMPLLRGKTAAEAGAEIQRLGLTANVEQVSSSLPPGRVLVQDPEEGTKMRRAQTVLLQVSKGTDSKPVPDVRGLTVAQAQSSIRERGFEAGDVIYVKDDSRPAGSVVAQSPAAPASVPSDKKIDLLVNQAGPAADGKVTVPDVAQMSEAQARELLTASGLKVMVIDSVYSPNAAEGSVIGTRPAAGAAAKAGDGIRLRVASAKRSDEAAESPKPAAAAEPATAPRAAAGTGGTDTATNTNISVFDQRRDGGQPANPSSAPAASPPTAPASAGGAAPPPVGGKIARVRYQVPPLARALQLKIELVDPTGTKTLLDRPAKSGEYISLDAGYSKECAVTIYLGGEFIWQDKYM